MINILIELGLFAGAKIPPDVCGRTECISAEQRFSLVDSQREEKRDVPLR
jgi:hypothetical protein